MPRQAKKPRTTYHQSDNADVYRKNASFVFSSEYTAPVLRLLDPQPGERIVDLGCGTGELTIEIGRILGSTGCIVGQDVSSDMIITAELQYIKEAGMLESNLAAANFKAQDGHDGVCLPFNKLPVDKVFSNAALHWMKRSPQLVLSHVFGALKPGGRFAAELGGHMNCVGVRSALHRAIRARGLDPDSLDPWFFPTAEQYSTMLRKEGFVVESCELVPRLTPLPKKTGLKGWLSTFAGPFLNALPTMAEEIVDEVEEALKVDMYDEGSGVWTVMYVRLRVLAFKPE
ncbi:methyltransferase [Pseudozyma hubeiensis SY62]|uniref:Methyltransferase n=1 Tax=Pseudozyma hubeiensis (strain SY62) TaxID=1305764 RepID=R9P4M5_PSEHS|nr:methyltransferase [Pseudozyma hubeiensis SY62]GAC93060.1 methyltransferase [Pseudozyma hubeiensis SY62]